MRGQGAQTEGADNQDRSKGHHPDDSFRGPAPRLCNVALTSRNASVQHYSDGMRRYNRRNITYSAMVSNHGCDILGRDDDAILAARPTRIR